MNNRFVSLLLTGLIFLLVVAMGGCRRASTTAIAVPSVTSSPSEIGEVSTPVGTEPQPYPPPTQAVNTQATSSVLPQPTLPSTAQPSRVPYPFPQPTGESVYPAPIASTPSASPAPLESATSTSTNMPEASQTEQLESATSTATVTPESQYPGPQETEIEPYPGPQETESQPYPGPEVTQTPSTSPGQVTKTSTRTPRMSATPSSQPSGTIFPSPTSAVGAGTPAATPTELPPRPPLSPPPAGSNVSIWYSWSLTETEVLRSIIRSFQRLYPDVTFNLVYVPLDDLFDTYQEAAYLGQGPSLLLGPAEWGPELFKGELITDLNPYIPSDYLSSINPAALDSGRFNEALISLPLAQHGVVMFRNSTLIGSPGTFDELTRMSHEATHAGMVGSYLERGAYFSSADLLGLGGSLMDADHQPTFTNQAGLEWLNLLRAYHDAGAVTFNTNRDLDMFKRGRVGIIIDGTWNIKTLTDAIGSDRLLIDPWPTFGNGHMSGWVDADSVFLNANVTGNDRFAALAFMGYLLDPNVQVRLAEVGHIPSVIAATPRDPLIQQAMDAFSDGVPYPITVDASVLSLYWDELNSAIQDVFIRGIDPAKALKTASEEIKQGLLNSQTAP